MPHWKSLLTMFVVALVAIFVANRVAFIKNITG